MSFAYSAVTYFMEMKVSNMHFQKEGFVGLSLSYGGIYVISPWIMTTFATWIRRYFFVFIYGNLVIGLFFPLILFLMWRKEQKDEKI